MFFNRQVLRKVWAGANCVSSGTVTSLTNSALSPEVTAPATATLVTVGANVLVAVAVGVTGVGVSVGMGLGVLAANWVCMYAAVSAAAVKIAAGSTLVAVGSAVADWQALNKIEDIISATHSKFDFLAISTPIANKSYVQTIF